MVSWGNKAVRRRETFISHRKKCESIGWRRKDIEEMATSAESRDLSSLVIYGPERKALGQEPGSLGSILIPITDFQSDLGQVA